VHRVHPAGRGVRSGDGRNVTERQWQSQVVEAARLLGWRVYHTHDSRRSEPGWPDLALVRDRLVMAELKTDNGRVSKAQAGWLDALRTANVETYLWRPSDWDAVLATLKATQSERLQEGAAA
jgi:hypothetical protein